MQTVKLKLYSFDELSKDAQQKVISHFSEVGYDDWYESTFEDAKNIGLELGEFGFDSASFVRNLRGEFTLSAHEVAANIIRDHGESCETNKTAQIFLDGVNSVTSKAEGKKYENKMMQLEDEFLNNILEDYTTMLQEEYEYLSSEEAITENIKANDYLFFVDGELAHITHYVGKHEKSGITELRFHGETFTL